MLIWQVGGRDFCSIDPHHDSIVLWIDVSVAVAKMLEIKYLVLLSKHVGSFCTVTTNYV